MHLAIESLPAQGAPEQLVLLLHGVGSSGASMAALAQALRHEFPQAALLAPDAPEAFDGGGTGRQWFSVAGIDEANRPERVAEALPALWSWVRAEQRRLGVPAPATAIAGFSQGAILALETAAQCDGLAGRVLAFSGRFARLPARAPRLTTLHLFHGATDAVIDAAHARHAFETLAGLNGDATLDVAEGLGHVLHPALVDRAIFRLRHHIPARTWAEALGSAPPGALADDDEPLH
ncbi:phospholipase/carboxylesterase [Rubrivivax gelatinosus]|uniref:esterase n=1 Tax=Rubrivivax gelatinosus TaxID=28068 RepID=UPI0018CAB83C|nr:esterase [Rubrivivax gelatinosus]MBG6081261.1 phospholipase/carboxylesterase [Rubrivivax gelatinosus]